MKYDVVIWDFDGTLAYTSEDVWESIEYAAYVCGGITSKIDKTFREKSSNLNESMKEIFKAIKPSIDEKMFELFQEQVRIHYREISDYPNTILYPGISELLQYLKESGVNSYIVSLKPSKALEQILRKKKWNKYFAGCFSPDFLEGRERTKSELIAYLIEKERLMPERIVYIGDTYSDVIAAKNNCVDCIGVTYGDGDKEKLLEANPMVAVNEVNEIYSLLSEV